MRIGIVQGQELNLCRLPSLFLCLSFFMEPVSILLLCFLLVQALAGASGVVIGLRRRRDATHHRFGGGADQVACDIFTGSWVRDDTYPLYQSLNCPAIDSQFNCQLYGRPDSDYLRYRWRPAGCELPRSISSSATCLLRFQLVRDHRIM